MTTKSAYSVTNMRVVSQKGGAYVDNPMPGGYNIFDGYNEGKAPNDDWYY